MVLKRVFNRLKNLAVISSLLVLGLFLLGARPGQGGVPPQPYGANFFSGIVTVEGQIPPEGTQIIGCVADCVDVFESEPALTDADGNYVALQLNPDDEELVGRLVTFHLVNEFGRIDAVETRRFEGDFNIYALDLTFTDPIPVFMVEPTPVPIPTTLSLVPNTGLVSTVNGAGFGPGSMVTVTSEGMVLGTAAADDAGSFRLVISAPSSTQGTYEISATDGDGTQSAVNLTVPDLSGATGAQGSTGAAGTDGVDGEDGADGATGLTGEDASKLLGIIALSLAGLGILIIIVIYLYLISWFNDLARRLPPPGIR